MNNLKYSEILRLNKELEDNDAESYNISFFSNVVVHQVKEITECLLRNNKINANVSIGDYDNIVQDSNKKLDAKAIIIFWELGNLLDGFNYKIDLIHDNKITEIENKIKSEIKFVIKNLELCPILLINKFSSLFFSKLSIKNNKLDKLADRLNLFLEDLSQINMKLINLDKIIADIGIDKSFNSRDYYSSKAPYTVNFFKKYAQAIKPLIMSANGKSKKVLIFDCDNTLWKGILGEDGIGGIELSADTKNGLIFQEIQSIALSLSQQGVILGLCSKNNLEDVDEVLMNFPDMILQDKHITIKEINWSDKVTNLRKISKKLNIGLDSFVFIDDSSFEINLVKEQLPEIKVFQVPELLHEYPQMLRDNLGLFYNLSATQEDYDKTKIYREQIKREEIKDNFSSIQDYLISLELKVTIFKNELSLVSRMAQMTQKTNQFNLATKRYTETEIKNIVLSPTADIFAFSAKDKYGDSGVTGLCIVNINNQNALIDTFLMSCRVIGRNIEFFFMDYIVKSLINKNVITIKSIYNNTMKNKQVEEFYDNCSFDIMNRSKLSKHYILEISKYKQHKKKYIELINND